MFGYFGTKHHLAASYPPPIHDTIIEPFAGAAGYAMHSDNWTRNVVLVDKNPDVIAVWKWLQAASAEDVLALPDIEYGPYPVPKGSPPKFLMEWSQGSPSGNPNVVSTWMARDWPRNRSRIAANVHKIKHWQIIEGDYTAAPDVEATWVIDPPYQHQGHQYKTGSVGIDYERLAEWSIIRCGQIIVCEQEGADWLPFRHHKSMKTQANKTRSEVVWMNTTDRLFE